MEKPKLYKARFTFTQPANCITNNDEGEEITIQLRSDLWPKKDNHFFVIKTKKWSIDSVDEFKELLEICTKILPDGK